ncbi:TPA: hypothetical protein DEP96_02620 [Candidatus Uhrbacteria bacterium]|nr:hypothetical protein [Candidatus Uhrbacteria bacterium]
MNLEIGGESKDFKGQDFKRLPNPERMTDDALIADMDRLIGGVETADEAREIILNAYSPRPVVTVEAVEDGRSFTVNIRTRIDEEPRTYIIDRIAKAAKAA